MVDRCAFGAQLRRVRLREGVSLQAIAAATNMPVTLWESLEDGELYGWPSGLLARSMVRDYARLVRLDPDDTINQFCRLFPNGDRRRASQLDALATLINHAADANEDDRPAAVERRGVALLVQRDRAAARRRRTIDALLIAATIAGAIFVAHALTHLPLSICAATAAAAGLAAAGPIRRLIGRRAAGRRARQALVAAWWKRFGRGIGAHP